MDMNFKIFLKYHSFDKAITVRKCYQVKAMQYYCRASIKSIEILFLRIITYFQAFVYTEIIRKDLST